MSDILSCDCCRFEVAERRRRHELIQLQLSKTLEEERAVCYQDDTFGGPLIPERYAEEFHFS